MIIFTSFENLWEPFEQTIYHLSTFSLNFHNNCLIYKNGSWLNSNPRTKPIERFWENKVKQINLVYIWLTLELIQEIDVPLFITPVIQ